MNANRSHKLKGIGIAVPFVSCMLALNLQSTVLAGAGSSTTQTAAVLAANGYVTSSFSQPYSPSFNINASKKNTVQTSSGPFSCPNYVDTNYLPELIAAGGSGYTAQGGTFSLPQKNASDTGLQTPNPDQVYTIPNKTVQSAAAVVGAEVTSVQNFINVIWHHVAFDAGPPPTITAQDVPAFTVPPPAQEIGKTAYSPYVGTSYDITETLTVNSTQMYTQDQIQETVVTTTVTASTPGTPGTPATATSPAVPAVPGTPGGTTTSTATPPAFWVAHGTPASNYDSTHTSTAGLVTTTTVVTASTVVTGVIYCAAVSVNVTKPVLAVGIKINQSSVAIPGYYVNSTLNYLTNIWKGYIGGYPAAGTAEVNVSNGGPLVPVSEAGPNGQSAFTNYQYSQYTPPTSTTPSSYTIGQQDRSSFSINSSAGNTTYSETAVLPSYVNIPNLIWINTDLPQTTLTIGLGPTLSTGTSGYGNLAEVPMVGALTVKPTGPPTWKACPASGSCLTISPSASGIGVVDPPYSPKYSPSTGWTIPSGDGNSLWVVFPKVGTGYTISATQTFDLSLAVVFGNGLGGLDSESVPLANPVQTVNWARTGITVDQVVGVPVAP